jgi:hypothetical protein
VWRDRRSGPGLGYRRRVASAPDWATGGIRAAGAPGAGRGPSASAAELTAGGAQPPRLGGQVRVSKEVATRGSSLCVTINPRPRGRFRVTARAGCTARTSGRAMRRRRPTAPLSIRSFVLGVLTAPGPRRSGPAPVVSSRSPRSPAAGPSSFRMAPEQ